MAGRNAGRRQGPHASATDGVPVGDQAKHAEGRPATDVAPGRQQREAEKSNPSRNRRVTAVEREVSPELPAAFRTGATDAPLAVRPVGQSTHSPAAGPEYPTCSADADGPVSSVDARGGPQTSLRSRGRPRAAPLPSGSDDDFDEYGPGGESKPGESPDRAHDLLGDHLGSAFEEIWNRQYGAAQPTESIADGDKGRQVSNEPVVRELPSGRRGNASDRRGGG